MDDVVTGLLRLGPPLVKAIYSDTRVCVLSARVAIEVLHYFGVDARPFPCRVVAMNAIAAEGFVAGMSWPDIFEAGGYSLGQMGKGPLPGKRWDGHLAALVEHYCVEDGEKGALLVDFSLADLNRPDKGVHTAPLRATVPQRLIDDGTRIVLPLPEGGIAMYEPIEDNYWRQAPDWVDTKRWKPLVAQIIRALR